MLRLVYCSRNRGFSDAREIDRHVSTILEISIENNKKRGVTGGLIYDRHWFVQVLEGRSDAVQTIFQQILADPRHTDIRVMETADVAGRKFPHWWMAAAPFDVKLRSLGALGAIDFDPRLHTPSELVDLVYQSVHELAPSACF